MDDPRRRRDASASTYEQIRALIVERRIEPGTPLSAPELAEQLGVSRTPVREAIGTLVVEGLAVRSGTNRTMVAPVSVEELDHVYDVRAMLEGLIASDAARRVTQADVAVLEQKILLMDRLRDDHTQVVRFGAEFHDELQRISGNDLAVNLLRIVRGHVDRYRSLTSQSPGRASDAADEHREIFEAVIARDPELAEAVMREHLQAAKTLAISLMLAAHPTD